MSKDRYLSFSMFKRSDAPASGFLLIYNKNASRKFTKTHMDILKMVFYNEYNIEKIRNFDD